MTSATTTLEHILQEAKAQQWPYPTTFEALKKAGVTSYAVSFADKYTATYAGGFGTWQETAPPGHHAMQVNKIFSEQDVQKAIVRHMQKLTSYIECLEELAASGVSQYKVDMSTRTVTYLNDNASQSHQEHVPLLD